MKITDICCTFAASTYKQRDFNQKGLLSQLRKTVMCIKKERKNAGKKVQPKFLFVCFQCSSQIAEKEVEFTKYDRVSRI